MCVCNWAGGQVEISWWVSVFRWVLGRDLGREEERGRSVCMKVYGYVGR